MNLTKGKIRKLYNTKAQTAKRRKRVRRDRNRRRKSFRGKKGGVDLERRTLKKYGGNKTSQELFQESPYAEMEIDNGSNATPTLEVPETELDRESVSSVDTLPQPPEEPTGMHPLDIKDIPITPPPPSLDVDVSNEQIDNPIIPITPPPPPSLDVDVSNEQMDNPIIPITPPPTETEMDIPSLENIDNNAELIQEPEPAVSGQDQHQDQEPDQNPTPDQPQETTLETPPSDQSLTSTSRETALQSLANVMDYLTDTISEKVSENIILSRDRPQNGFRSVNQMANTLSTKGGTKKRTSSIHSRRVTRRRR